MRLEQQAHQESGDTADSQDLVGNTRGSQSEHLHPAVAEPRKKSSNGDSTMDIVVPHSENSDPMVEPAATKARHVPKVQTDQVCYQPDNIYYYTKYASGPCIHSQVSRQIPPQRL